MYVGRPCPVHVCSGSFSAGRRQNRPAKRDARTPQPCASPSAVGAGVLQRVQFADARTSLRIGGQRPHFEELVLATGSGGQRRPAENL
jgi:hypothetical protein